MNVGRSWRTPIKHDYLAYVIGQECGAAPKVGAKRGFWYDLTAGDAAPVTGERWEESCSPGILAYYAKGCHIPVQVRLYENAASTYGRLIENLSRHLPGHGYEQASTNMWAHPMSGSTITANFGSGADADVSDIQNDDAVFVINDPNAITEWAMRPAFAAEIGARTWLSRNLSTMGCNPAGLKRLDITERINWFDHVRQQQQALPSYRDLSLAVLDNDEAQWAYLVTTSRHASWVDKTTAAARRSAKTSGRTLTVKWWRQDHDGFDDLLLKLFLTKRELKQIVGREREWMAASNEQRLAMIPNPDAPNPEPLPDTVNGGELRTLFDLGGDAA